MRADERHGDPTDEDIPPPELLELLMGNDDRYGVRELVAVCGCLDALVALDGGPLEATEDDASPLPGRAGRLLQVVRETAACRNELERALRFPARLDDELLLAVGRFLRRSDVRTAVERHRSADRRLAAAVVWIVGRGNGEFGRRARRSAAMLWDWFGVSDASTIGRSLADQLGLLAPGEERFTEYAWTPIRLADPSLLIARTRRRLIEHRGVVARLVQEDRRRREEARALRPVGGGRLEISGRPASMSAAIKMSIDRRQSVALLVGDDPSDPEEILFLSVPDAHLLVQRVAAALSGPAAPGTTAA